MAAIEETKKMLNSQKHNYLHAIDLISGQHVLSLSVAYFELQSYKRPNMQRVNGE
jgi:hypothetical protein